MIALLAIFAMAWMVGWAAMLRSLMPINENKSARDKWVVALFVFAFWPLVHFLEYRERHR